MPIVVANLKPAVLAEIKRLVESGAYASPAEFLELAASNQLELERKELGGLASNTRRPASGHVSKERVRAVRGQRRAVPSKASRKSTVTPSDISETLERLRLPDDLAVPTSLSLKPPAIPEGEDRIWGQINRLLPLKVAVRWLGARALQKGAWSSVEEVLEQMALDAASVGSVLEAADADAERKRDELLATGLPRRANSLSMDRFISQYVARTTRKGIIHPGAVVQYGFASLSRDALTLTSTGFDFAMLRNPVLDNGVEYAKAALSDEERAFFVQHAVPQLPSELGDYLLVLSFVRDGRDTPGDQIDLIRDHLPDDWSDTMVRTHTTGVVARMVDLGLLRRQWQGKHVRYELTQLAAAFARTHVGTTESIGDRNA